MTPWRLSVGLQAFAESGAPLNKLGYFNGNMGRSVPGSAGLRRAPADLWGANLTLAYPIAIGPVTVTLQAYSFNVFNKQIAISRDDAWSDVPRRTIPTSVYDPNQSRDNPNYGDHQLPAGAQCRFAPRSRCPSQYLTFSRNSPDGGAVHFAGAPDFSGGASRPGRVEVPAPDLDECPGEAPDHLPEKVRGGDPEVNLLSDVERRRTSRHDDRRFLALRVFAEGRKVVAAFEELRGAAHRARGPAGP